MLQSSMVEIEGAMLHYVGGGRGRPLLFLHGFPEFWFAWRAQLTHFASSHRVIALDLPGCNRSDPLPEPEDYRLAAIADRIAAFIRRVAPGERVAVVGHDLGGILAWELAARHADVVDRLVAINAPPAAVLAREIERCPRQRAASAYRRQLATPGIEVGLAADDFAALAAGLFDEARDPEVFPAADRRAYRTAWSRPGALAGMLAYYRAWPTQVANPAPVEAPALVIWGEDDPFLLSGCVDGIEALGGEVEVWRIPGATHAVAREEPARVNAEIARFLARASRANARTRSSRLDVDVVDFTREHIAASAALMARSFATYDPLTRAAGIAEDEMYPYSLDIAEKAARDGISLAALDASGRVVGCVICEGPDDFIVPTRPLSSKFDAVFALVDELHHPFLTHERHQHPAGSIAHCTDLAVAVDVVGRGVASQLNLANAIRLRERGYRWAYSEFSNCHNYRSVQQYEHRVLARVDLPTYEYQGTRPFANATGFAISTFCPLPDPDGLRVELERMRR
jgi:pimeloyl-ACP methyl ester carboxylesterase